ncbi:MAG TPA: hypothetical protein VF331_21545 [Polyangiales bacterium]
MVSNRIGRKTAPGFADPRAPVSASSAAGAVGAPPAVQQEVVDARRSVPEPVAQRLSDPSKSKQTPMVEVEVSHERGSAPRAEPVRQVFEIWTHNHVYALDSRLHCREVRATAGGKAVADHPFLGSRLVGGQLQSEQAVEMSYPLPRPGAFAVFEARKGNRRLFSRTSAVVRVVLRLRVVTVTDPTAIPTWEQVAGDG